MKLEQIYTGCLAQGAYYIESNGEAAIIDPLREVQQYIDMADERSAKIKYIFETHFHADFVSGHVDLAKKTGATIVFGPSAETTYDSYTAKDNEEFKLGNVTIKVLHTPGHTFESSCFLLIDEDGTEKFLFSGDTLFIGDVGRPDLAIKSNYTKEDLAGLLFDSLRNRIMPLNDDILVYPAHGAGSACGKNLSSETFDTLGNQKKTNYALAEDLSKEAFIKEVTCGIMPPPQYFPKNAMMNKTGYAEIDNVLSKGNVALDVETYKEMASHSETLVIDTRTQEAFAAEHIPGSLFFGIYGAFAVWVGNLINDLNQPIIFIADEGKEEDVVTRLSRVGYDNSLGYLKGGIEAWKAAGNNVESIKSISATEFSAEKENNELNILDVRKPGEYDASHICGAESFPLDFLNKDIDKLDKNKEYYIHCAGGYRSVIFSSIIKAKGFTKFVDVAGGYAAIKKTSIKLAEQECQLGK